ncbi:MAG TPA: hypothetical protein DDY70_00825 [Clostridiales bacterium]|nr:hypothetical protein [Clostridiales bacterium]
MKVTLAEDKKGGAAAFFGGAASLTVAAIVVKVLGLIYKIPLARVLGDEGMGYFNSAYTVYSFFYLLATAGVPKAISIMTAECSARGLSETEEKIRRVAMRTFLIGGILITAAFLLLTKPLAVLIGNRNAAPTMIAIAPSIFFIALGGVIRGILAGHSRLFPIALSETVSGVGKLAFGLLFAMLAKMRGMPLPLISAFSIFGITLGSVFGFLVLACSTKSKISKKSCEKEGQNSKTESTGKILSRLFHVALPVTISAAVMSLCSLVDLGMIMKRLYAIGYDEAQATALYGNYTTLALPMFNLVATVIAPVSVAVLPLLTARFAVGEKEEFFGISRSALEIAAFLATPAAVMLALFGEPILALLFPAESAHVAAPLLAALAPAMVFMALLTMVNTTLEAAGFVRAPLLSMGIGAAVKIVVGYFLIGNERFGILGAPIGTVASYGVGLVFSLCLLYRKTGAVAPLFSVFFRPLLFSLLAASGTLLLSHALEGIVSSALSSIFALLLGASVYLVVSYFGGSFRVEKLKILSKYTKKR